jgi:hypothetical protein
MWAFAAGYSADTIDLVRGSAGHRNARHVGGRATSHTPSCEPRRASNAGGHLPQLHRVVPQMSVRPWRRGKLHNREGVRGALGRLPRVARNSAQGARRALSG